MKEKNLMNSFSINEQLTHKWIVQIQRDIKEFLANKVFFRLLAALWKQLMCCGWISYPDSIFNIKQSHTCYSSLHRTSTPSIKGTSLVLFQTKECFLTLALNPHPQEVQPCSEAHVATSVLSEVNYILTGKSSRTAARAKCWLKAHFEFFKML